MHRSLPSANTLALKVEREASKTIKPAFGAEDIFVMLRQSLTIYDLFCCLNAEETRKSGCMINYL